MTRVLCNLLKICCCLLCDFKHNCSFREAIEFQQACHHIRRTSYSNRATSAALLNALKRWFVNVTLRVQCSHRRFVIVFVENAFRNSFHILVALLVAIMLCAGSIGNSEIYL